MIEAPGPTQCGSSSPASRCSRPACSSAPHDERRRRRLGERAASGARRLRRRGGAGDRPPAPHRPATRRRRRWPGGPARTPPAATPAAPSTRRRRRPRPRSPRRTGPSRSTSRPSVARRRTRARSSRSLTTDISNKILPIVRECGATVPPRRSGAKPRLEGQIVIAIKNKQVYDHAGDGPAHRRGRRVARDRASSASSRRRSASTVPRATRRTSRLHDHVSYGCSDRGVARPVNHSRVASLGARTVGA